MGGLVAGAIDLFHGDPAKQQEAQLGGLGSYETGMGEGLLNAGAGYEEALLSGDPTRIAQTLAPEISAGQGQVEQEALKEANFGTRSGGATAATEAAPAAERRNIIDLAGGLQSGAASTSLSEGSGLLGQASSNIGEVAGLKEERRAETQTDIENINKGMNEIASRIMTRGMSSGGNDNLSPSPESGDSASKSAEEDGGGGEGMDFMAGGAGGGGGGEGMDFMAGGAGGGGG